MSGRSRARKRAQSSEGRPGQDWLPGFEFGSIPPYWGDWRLRRWRRKMFLHEDCLVQGLRFRSALKAKDELSKKSKASPRLLHLGTPDGSGLPRLTHSAWSHPSSIRKDQHW